MVNNIKLNLIPIYKAPAQKVLFDVIKKGNENSSEYLEVKKKTEFENFNQEK